MENQTERDLYKNLGQIILDSLTDQSMDKKWEKVILKVQFTHGSINYEANKYWKGNKESLWGVADPSLLSSTIKKLYRFTQENSYTQWNTFIYELTSDHKFDIKYFWDQELNDKYDELTS